MTHTRDFIKSNEILSIPGFADIVRLLLFKQDLQIKGLKGEALGTTINAADWTTLRSQYDNQKVKNYLNDPSRNNSIKLVVNNIVDKIAQIVQEDPAFRRFHDRIRVWKSYEGKVVQREVDDILDGDKPLPKGVEVDDDLRGKFVSEREEVDPRTKEPIVSKSGKPIKKDYIDPEKMQAAKVTQEEIDKMSKATYNYFSRQLLQKAYSPEEISYLDLVKCAGEKLTSKGTL